MHYIEKLNIIVIITFDIIVDLSIYVYFCLLVVKIKLLNYVEQCIAIILYYC